MDKLETLTTLGTQNRERRQLQQTQKMSNTDPTEKMGVNPDDFEEIRSSRFLKDTGRFTYIAKSG